jgi:cytochrome d ubiquinol oxidase subunit II
MNLPDLNVIWYVLVGVLFTGYAMLDGFDLGVGVLQLFVRKDEHRRLFLNSIGPVWDGNEVWLVTGGGALFAAFPEAYATVFSGFYLPFMLLLCSLIFRAVAIEFRSKEEWTWWRQFWDVAFSAGSLLASLLIGVAMGNIVRGIPLDGDHEFAGSFLGLLNPYALLMGVTTVLLFAMHGAIYLAMNRRRAEPNRQWLDPQAHRIFPRLLLSLQPLHPRRGAMGSRYRACATVCVRSRHPERAHRAEHPTGDLQGA